MKTWILVWFLILPANEDGSVEFEYGQHTNLTQAECVQLLAEVDLDYLLMARRGEIFGHTINCKEVK